jgi:streptogramin lyase
MTRALLVALTLAMVLSCACLLAEPALAASPLHISQAYATPMLELNGSTTLTFTISNTAPSTGQSGIAFSAALPAGLAVATPSGLDSGCGGSVVLGTASVALAGGSLPANAVCTVSLNVAGVATGTQSGSVTVTSNGGTGTTSGAQILVVSPPSFTGGRPVTELTGGVTYGFTAHQIPVGITSGPDGHIWFSENTSNPGAVARVNGDGTVSEFAGGVTSGFTSHVQPSGITTGPDGAIWFTEADRGLARVNGNGSVSEFPAGSNGFTAGRIPQGVTSGPDGNIWFTELWDPGGLGRLNFTGGTANGSVTEFTGGVTSGFHANRLPQGITSSPDGNIWFTEGANPGALGRLTSNGTVTELTGGVAPGFTANEVPREITTGPDGKIWFTEGPYNSAGAVGRVNGDGTVSEYTGGVTPGFTAGLNPQGIATGPDGHIWFTEAGNHLEGGGVGRVNGDGTVSEFAGGVTPGFTANQIPTGITTGPDGNVWFTENSGPGAVARIAPRSPGVATSTPADLGGKSATLTGSVNADGLTVTDCHFEYGVTTVYYARVPCSQQVGGGTDTVAVSASIGALDPAKSYHFRLVATNAAATNVSDDQTFVTLAVPVVDTGAAGSIGPSTTTLVGTVNANAHAVTDCHFEYGISTAYGASIPCAQSVGGGFRAVAVSANVSGLEPETTYHVQLVATNALGTGRGADRVFTTLAPVAPVEAPFTTSPAVNQTVTKLAPPVLSRLTLTPSRFRAARGKTGTRIRYGDSAQATTRFTVERMTVGVRVGRRCLTLRHRAARGRRGKHCSLLVVVGTFTHVDAPGTNSFRFTGRVSRRTLSPGAYALVVIASNGGGSSNRLTAKLKIFA